MTVSKLKSLWEKIQPQFLGKTIFQPVRQPHPDTQRVTKAPILIVLGMSLLIILGLGFTAYSKAQYHSHASQPRFKTRSSTSEIPDWFTRKQAEGIIAGEEEKPKNDPAKPEAVTGALGHGSELKLESEKDTLAQTNETDASQAADQEQMTLEMQQRTTLTGALQSETTLFRHQKTERAITQPASTGDALPDSGDGPKIESEQYLLHERVPAVSKDEVKAGTVIPSVLLSGIDSTLAGQLIAQVTENVYDTATGQHLLIPQGARLVGRYDHQIAGGQKRVLIVWNRLIYPDASSVTLDGMSGVDMAGYTGFSDKTDTHVWLTFRHALLLSTISAAVQLSQPRATNGNAYSANQVAAGALGQQMNQVGMNSIGRVQSQPPTLRIRPGYRFNVLVNKDMVLPTWTTHEAVS